MSKIKENFKNNKYFLLAFLVIWTIVTVTTLNSSKASLGKESFGNEQSSDMVVELNEHTTISEEFSFEEENVESVAVKFATYARKNSGKAKIVVVGLETKNIYIDEEFNISSIQDNAFITWSLDNLKDKNIRIELSSNSKEGKSIGVYCSSISAFEQSKLVINGNEYEDGDLTVKYLCANESYSKFSNFIVYSLTIIITLLIVVYLLVNPKLEYLFVFIILSMGLIFTCIITPMSVPDEGRHYEAALELSNEFMGLDRMEVDAGLQDYGYFGDHVNASTAYDRLINKFNKPLKETGEFIDTNVDIDDGYKAYFVPQALGVTIGRMANWGMLPIFYLGRLCNLLFYTLCVFLAIKKAAGFKMLIGILASLPMFLQQAASYSYDAFIIGLSFVTFAYFIKWYKEQTKIKLYDFAILLIVSMLLAPAKIVYGVFALLFWLIPKNRYSDKKTWFIYPLLICSPAMYAILSNIFIRLETTFEILIGKHPKTMFLLKDINAETIDKVTETLNGVDAIELGEDKFFDFKYIFFNPGKTIAIIYRTVRYNLKKWFYDSITHTLSGQTLILPTWFTYVFIGLVLVSSMLAEGVTVALIVKVGFVICCLAVGAFTIFGMLMGWTARNDEMINGIQGRYFSPVLAYFFAIFKNNKFELPKFWNKYVMFIYFMMMFKVVIYVLSYTFVN